MLHLLALLYGLLVMFLLNCASRNVRAKRSHGPTLTVIGFSTIGASVVIAALLFAMAAGVIVVIIPA